MSKSQSEFPSPKKLCRALHSAEAHAVMLIAHVNFVVTILNSGVYKTTF